jgi:hypothetical protein
VQNDIRYKIKEGSWLAKLASIKLKEPRIAMVWGTKILLYGVTEEDFLNNKKWLKHELAHVKQFKEYGFFCFIVRYLFETYKNGYTNNRFEIEARDAEDL